MENLKSKIEGCIKGAVMGSEIGTVHASRIGQIANGVQLKNALEEKIDLDNIIIQQKYNTWSSSLTPLIQITASAYIKKRGRIVPEDFAAELATDESLADRAVFWYLDLYSAIERLHAGMNPRINGIGACPDGNICTAMAVVGIYHAKDPEYAYIDGIELSGVIQRKPAAEWAALTAAAVAEALNEDCTASKLVKNITEMTFRYCKDTYYEILRNCTKIS